MPFFAKLPRNAEPLGRLGIKTAVAPDLQVFVIRKGRRKTTTSVNLFRSHLALSGNRTLFIDKSIPPMPTRTPGAVGTDPPATHALLGETPADRIRLSKPKHRA